MKNRLGPNDSGANGTCMAYSAASMSLSGMIRLRAGWRRLDTDSTRSTSRPQAASWRATAAG